MDDVKEHARQRLTSAGTAGAPGKQTKLPDFTVWGDIDEETMTKVRRLTAEQMERAWHTVPQVTHHDLADITELENLRQRLKGRANAAGAKLTITAMLVKIAASALRLFPYFNSSIDIDRATIIRKSFINIGVAVDTPHGLLVPVISAPDTKNIKEIALELDDLSSRARERKVKPEELRGATFTISNLGGIGGTGFSPIVNWPEVAILGVSRSRTQPEWTGAEFKPRLMLPISLSYDHRLIDGAEAARFVRWIADTLEEPMLLALEG
jgi:pyruvate dehydrogenase E2 component (dihydrolipoamide acetyltransferase)